MLSVRGRVTASTDSKGARSGRTGVPSARRRATAATTITTGYLIAAGLSVALLVTLLLTAVPTPAGDEQLDEHLDERAATAS